MLSRYLRNLLKNIATCIVSSFCFLLFAGTSCFPHFLLFLAFHSLLLIPCFSLPFNPCFYIYSLGASQYFFPATALFFLIVSFFFWSVAFFYQPFQFLHFIPVQYVISLSHTTDIFLRVSLISSEIMLWICISNTVFFHFRVPMFSTSLFFFWILKVWSSLVHSFFHKWIVGQSSISIENPKQRQVSR